MGETSAPALSYLPSETPMPLNRPLSDPELTALLRALPRHAPSAGFADRVLARVPLAAPVPLWRRIPWRALAGILTVEVGLAAVFLLRFRDELIHVPARALHGLTDLIVALRTADLSTAAWERFLSLAPRVGSILASTPTLPVALLLGTFGTLLMMSLLGRGWRASTLRR